MSQVTTAEVKQLRELTGAGMMDCKRALTEAGGDLTKAIEVLRVKGAKDIGKRVTRTAANGLVAHAGGALVEVNCETDFVAKNDEFVALAQQIAEHAAATRPADLEGLLASPLAEGRTVAETVADQSSKIGEKLVVSRYATLEGSVSVYLHKKATDLPPQVGVLVGYSAGDEADVRAVGMQIAAMRPRYLSREEVPDEVVESERRIAEQIAREEGKPEQAIPKIIDGRVNAFFKDFVLLEQASVVEPKQSVSQVLAEAGVTLTGFVRFEVGQAE